MPGPAGPPGPGFNAPVTSGEFLVSLATNSANLQVGSTTIPFNYFRIGSMLQLDAIGGAMFTLLPGTYDNTTPLTLVLTLPPGNVAFARRTTPFVRPRISEQAGTVSGHGHLAPRVGANANARPWLVTHIDVATVAPYLSNVVVVQFVPVVAFILLAAEIYELKLQFTGKTA